MAQWTTAFINGLPDSSFLYISASESKGKDGEGKTVPRSARYFPYKDSSGKVDLPHLRNALARIPQSNVPDKAGLTSKAQKILQSQNGGRSKDEFRALPADFELRDGDGEMPTLVGHLAVFDEWAEIDSRSEGHFLERIAPGAFDKTISENRDKMRVLFQHGRDPQIGDKPLGPIASLKADERGVHYEVPLLPTDYNRELIPGLKAGLYGSSFRFKAIRDDWNQKASKSDYNPLGIRERTVKEVRMPEFGPVTFPAYWGAKSGLRSLTDRIVLGERMDTEDLDCLAQMIALAIDYIDEQDDPGDEVNVPKMQGVITVLNELQQYEIQEDEPADEPEDEEEMASANERAAGANDAPPNDGAGNSHPIRGRRADPAPLYKGKEVGPRWQL